MPTIGSPSAPATALEYAQGLLQIQTKSDLLNLTAYLDSTEFTHGTNNGAFLFHDYSTNTLVLYHPLYTGSEQSGIISRANLSPAAGANLVSFLNAHAPDGHPYADYNQANAALDSGLTLLIVGGLLVATSIVLAYFNAPVAIWVLRVGLAAIVAGIVVEAAGGIAGSINSVFNPQLIDSTSNGGTTCKTYSSAVGGCVIYCIHADGSTSTTSCGGGPSSLGLGLVWIAVGIAAIVAVGVGGYVLYRYVSNRPRPGFGNYPSRSEALYRLVKRPPSPPAAGLPPAPKGYSLGYVPLPPPPPALPP